MLLWPRNYMLLEVCFAAHCRSFIVAVIRPQSLEGLELFVSVIALWMELCFQLNAFRSLLSTSSILLSFRLTSTKAKAEEKTFSVASFASFFLRHETRAENLSLAISYTRANPIRIRIIVEKWTMEVERKKKRQQQRKIAHRASVLRRSDTKKPTTSRGEKGKTKQQSASKIKTNTGNTQKNVIEFIYCSKGTTFVAPARKSLRRAGIIWCSGRRITYCCRLGIFALVSFMPFVHVRLALLSLFAPSSFWPHPNKSQTKSQTESPSNGLSYRPPRKLSFLLLNLTRLAVAPLSISTAMLKPKGRNATFLILIKASLFPSSIVLGLFSSSLLWWSRSTTHIMET